MKRLALSVFFFGLLTLVVLAHDSLITVDKIGGITVVPGVDTIIVVPYLPYTVFIEGTANHEGQGNLITLELWGMDDGVYFYGPARYFKNYGGLTYAPYVIPWTITYAGPHSLEIGAFHANGDNANCPAAPSIVNNYLKENNLSRMNGDGENVISAVAKETGKGGILWAKEKCAAGYEAATISFVVGNLGE